MAATAGSVYQIKLQNHISGSPPYSDPQRSTETFQGYKDRMAAHGFPPDIGPTESDAAYLARLATYGPAVVTENITASYALNAFSASYAP